MIVGLNPAKAPLRKYESQHLREIKLRELQNNLLTRGVEIAASGDGAVKLNLRNLIPANGDVRRGQVSLMETLRDLGADAVSLEPADVNYIGGRDVFSHAVARGLESGVEPIQELLCDIPITEDGDGEDVVPIFDRLDRAAAFVSTDVNPDLNVREYLKRGAANDLVQNNLLEPNSGYRSWLDEPHDDVPELPLDFRADAKPYRSPFDNSGEGVVY